MPRKKDSVVYGNMRGTTTEQFKTARDGKQRRKNLGFSNEEGGDKLYSASKYKGDKVSRYMAVTDGAPTDKGAVGNRKNIRSLMKQLDRIRANSDGSERHQRLVEKAERAVNAYAAYQSLGGQG